MQFQQVNNSYSSIYYPIFNNTKDTATGFLKYNYLNSKYYKFNPNVSSNNTFTEKQAENNSILDIKFSNTDSFLFVILFLFALLAYVQLNGKNFIHVLSSSVRSNFYSNALFNEKNLSLNLFGYILQFIFFISFGLLMTFSIEILFPKIIYSNRFYTFIILSITFFSLYSIQNFFFLFLGLIFSKQKLAKEHLFFVSNTIKLAGIAILILVSAIFFADNEIKIYLTYLALFFGFIVYFAKIFRLLITFLQNGFSILYMFLYFCAVEIIPVLLLVKILFILIELNFNILDILV